MRKADFPINVEIWDDKNVTVYRSNDTRVIYSAPQPLKASISCIPTVSTVAAFAGSTWKLAQYWARENALWCVEGLEYQASLACDKRHFTAKSGMCNCVYFFGSKVEAAAQIGSTKIFTTARAQINSSFFLGISALEWSMSDKNYAMGIATY